MSLAVAIQMDPIESINIDADSFLRWRRKREATFSIIMARMILRCGRGDCGRGRDA